MDKITILLPAPGESIKEVRISRFFVEEGGFVAKDGVICEVESDKAAMEVLSPKPGKVHLKLEAGGVYPVGTIVAEVDTSVQKPIEKSVAKAPKEEPLPKSAPPVAASLHPIRTGKEEYLHPPEIVEPIKQEESAKKNPPTLSQEKEKREPMSLIRKTIAKRLVEVKNQTAMLTTFNEVDMSHLLKLRKEFQETFTKKYGIKLGFMGFFTKAVERALQIYPRINARIEGEDVVYPQGIHVGIAVSTDRGLVVPVLRNVEQKTLAEIELEIGQLATKGREGKLGIKDFEGGSFTITNGGVFGSLLSTPILNPPQSGILGMHATVERPVAIQGKVEIRPMMYIALSYDHRIVDGKEAVGFLVEVKRWIEAPEIGILGL